MYRQMRAVNEEDDEGDEDGSDDTSHADGKATFIASLAKLSIPPLSTEKAPKNHHPLQLQQPELGAHVREVMER